MLLMTMVWPVRRRSPVTPDRSEISSAMHCNSSKCATRTFFSASRSRRRTVRANFPPVGSMDRVLATASRRQHQYWSKRAGVAEKKLEAAQRTELKARRNGNNVRVTQRQQKASPFALFVQETMGSREHDVSPSLFIQASILRWQFMSSAERKQFR